MRVVFNHSAVAENPRWLAADSNPHHRQRIKRGAGTPTMTICCQGVTVCREECQVSCARVTGQEVDRKDKAYLSGYDADEIEEMCKKSSLLLVTVHKIVRVL